MSDKKKRIEIHLTPEQAEMLERLAEKDGRSRKNYVENLVLATIHNEEKKGNDESVPALIHDYPNVVLDAVRDTDDPDWVLLPTGKLVNGHAWGIYYKREKLMEFDIPLKGKISNGRGYPILTRPQFEALKELLPEGKVIEFKY